jgi:hypothetical protein
MSSAGRPIPRPTKISQSAEGKIARPADGAPETATYRRTGQQLERSLKMNGPEETTVAARLGRFVPLAGVGTAVLTIAGYLVIDRNPDSGASTSTLTAYYSAHHAHVFAAGILLTYASILFALFGVAVWSRIRSTALHPIVAGAALVATAIATVADLANASAWYLLGDIGYKHTISPGALQTLHISVSASDLTAGAGVGILLVAFALAGILARAFPRWLAWSALVLGILQLAPTPGLVGFFAGLAFLPWTFAASIAMFLRPGDAALAPGQLGSTPATPQMGSTLPA